MIKGLDGRKALMFMSGFNSERIVSVLKLNQVHFFRRKEGDGI